MVCREKLGEASPGCSSHHPEARPWVLREETGKKKLSKGRGRGVRSRLWFNEPQATVSRGEGKEAPWAWPPPAPRHRYLPPPCSAPLPIRACRRQSHALAVHPAAPHAPGTPAATQAALQKVGSLVARKYERLPALKGLDNKAKITDICFYFVLFLFFFSPAQ